MQTPVPRTSLQTRQTPPNHLAGQARQARQTRPSGQARQSYQTSAFQPRPAPRPGGATRPRGSLGYARGQTSPSGQSRTSGQTLQSGAPQARAASVAPPAPRQARPTPPPATQSAAKAKGQNTYSNAFLLAAFMYLGLAFTGYWATGGLVGAMTNGALTLHFEEILFILAYLIVAVLPALLARYALATCLLAAATLWRGWVYGNVLASKSYEVSLNLFAPGYYWLMGTALALGIALEIKRWRQKRQAQ